MRQIRLCYPAKVTLYWIQDNLSANWTPEVREFAGKSRIVLVPTPTYASYLNPIESHFWPIAEFVVKNTDYLDWDAFAHALARHISYRNGPHRDRRLAQLEAKLRVVAWLGFGYDVGIQPTRRRPHRYRSLRPRPEPH